MASTVVEAWFGSVRCEASVELMKGLLCAADVGLVCLRHVQAEGWGRPLVMRHPVMADPTGPLQQYILSCPRCGMAAEVTELTRSWATILWLLACEDFAMPFGPGRRDPLPLRHRRWASLSTKA
jgi:hypothetical protein